MKLVSEESLHTAIDSVEGLDEDGAMVLMERFAEYQPTMFVYVMSLEELFDSEEDFHALVHLVIVGWMAFQEEFGSLPRIMDQDILRWEQRSMVELGEMEGLEEDDLMLKAIDLLSQEVQPILMHFLADELVCMEEEGELEGGEDAAGQMFPILRMLVELLDDMVNRPRLRIVD